MAPAAVAHRLTLTGPQWLALCRAAGIAPPGGFSPVEEVPEPELATAERELTEQDVLAADGSGPHPSIAANLAVLVAPTALVRVAVSIRDSGQRGAYAIRDPLGASLFATAGGGVELSLFPAVDLGPELRRSVPEIPPAASDRTTMARLVPGPPAAPVSGRLPLAALADHGVPSDVHSGGRVTEAEADLAADLIARTVGVLSCLVVGARTGEGNPALAGDLVWFATDSGWVGVRPWPDGSGRQLVDLVPVEADEIGSWLAPYLARILEGTDG